VRAALEVIAVPVTDADRAKAFYSGALGFVVDVDYAPSDAFRVVQLTPQGSSASLQLDVTDPDGNVLTLQERR
jgi:catechol 2,3-dioxygenase-like lactoylglutathione lyase family enzyme